MFKYKPYFFCILYTSLDRVAAVFGAEETDGGGLKGFVGLFKLKGGLRFGCVCVYVQVSRRQWLAWGT